MFQMVCGKLPFNAANNAPATLMEKVKNKDFEFPRDVQLSPLCMDVIYSCMKKDPEERISFVDLFKHPFSTYSPLDEYNKFMQGGQVSTPAMKPSRPVTEDYKHSKPLPKEEENP